MSLNPCFSPNTIVTISLQNQLQWLERPPPSDVARVLLSKSPQDSNAMSGENVILPRALLNYWGGPKIERGLDDTNPDVDPEGFDVTQVAARAAGHIYVEDREDPLLKNTNVFQSRRRGATLEEVSRPHIAFVPSRSRTINLGQLERSRVTGRPDPADFDSCELSNGLSLIAGTPGPLLKGPLSEKSRAEQSRGQLETTKTLHKPDFENSYVLRSLDEFAFPAVPGGRPPEHVVFTEGEPLENQADEMPKRPSISRDDSKQSRQSANSGAPCQCPG